MSEEKDHILRDTDKDTPLGKRRGHLMRKEDERAEAEEHPIYPITTPEETAEEAQRRKTEQDKKAK